MEEKTKENEFKKFMIKQFAENEKLEQKNAQVRRMRELQHKKEIDELWNEKLKRIEDEKKQQEFEINEQKKKQIWEEEIIKNEKRRLLEKHLPEIQEFCSPEIWEEARRLCKMK